MGIIFSSILYAIFSLSLSIYINNKNQGRLRDTATGKVRRVLSILYEAAPLDQIPSAIYNLYVV